jgi:hypothetical protein
MKAMRTVAVVALFGMAACSGTSDGTDKFLTGDQYDKEFRRELTSLDFPAGKKLPDEAPGSLKDKYERGSGRTAADAVWLCSWQKAWLDARTSGAKTDADAALTALKTFPSLHYWKVLDQTGRDLYNKDLRSAELGDPAGISADYTANCHQDS